MVVCNVIECLIKTLLYSLLILLTAIVGLKLWLEPVKGVCKCKTKLKGKIALVTGGNSGIGLETAKDLARRGAKVIIASRDDKKSMEAVADIITTTGNLNVEYKHLDLASFSSIKKFSRDFNNTYDKLDLLVNNAGAAGLKIAKTDDGIDRLIQINYVGPFLLTNLLLDKVAAARPSRIVIVSSYANHFHSFNVIDVAGERALSSWKRYCNTKLCNVLWAKALAKRLPEGVTANSLHPGVVKTDIFKRVPEFPKNVMLWVIDIFFKTPLEGAQTSIHLCVCPDLDHVSGEYFSDCKLSKAAKITQDEAIADKLWEETMRIVTNKL